MLNTYNDNIEADIVQALLGDSRFDFKESPKYLNGGRCPQCGKKELFTAKDQPYVIKCNRANNCGHEEHARDLYPDLFGNFSKRFPATEADPNATARAYMQGNRGFPLDKIGDWFSQESYRLPDSNEYADTVRFYFDAERTRYWERLIDKSKSNGQRHNIGGKRKSLKPSDPYYNDYNGTLYKGEWWTPPGQTINKYERVYLVEGIFHAIALHLAGYKVAATIAANNFPRIAMKEHFGKDVIWCWALDDDKAGRDYMIRHRNALAKEGEGERCLFVLTGSTKHDWDDLYRAGKIDERFMKQCHYRGNLFGATSIREKAYHWYCHTRQSYTVLPFGNRFYSVSVDDKLAKELGGDIGQQMDIEDDEDIQGDGDHLKTDEGRNLFYSHLSVHAISNCEPQFLYCEQNQLTLEIAYFFSLTFPRMPERKIAMTGSALESPASFNKALLNQAPGASFDGSANQLKRIREDWFDGGVKLVETVPFVGYDKQSGTYVYGNWGYQNGRPLKLNAEGYLEAGKHRVKSSLKSITINHSEEFDPSWLGKFVEVFHYQGVAALAYWLGSLFAVQIRANHKDYPFFELTGDHGAGKTTLLEFLWKLVGRDDYEGFDPSKSTFAARTRNFSQVSGMPVALIEGDRLDDKAKKGAFDFEELKTAYNGRTIRSTGSFTRGNETEEPPFLATIVIAQNQSVQGSPALMSRICHAHCTKHHFTPQGKRLGEELKRMPVEQLSGFLTACLKKETAILERFNQLFPEIDQDFHDRNEIKDPRVCRSHAMLAALAQCLPLVFSNYPAELINQVHEYIYSRAKDRQTRMDADHPLVQEFWETYDYLNVRTQRDRDAFAGTTTLDVETLNHSSTDDSIAINLKHFEQVCDQNRIKCPPTADLKKVLTGSQRHKYVGTKNVKSKLFRDGNDSPKAVWCWVFKKGDQREK